MKCYSTRQPGEDVRKDAHCRVPVILPDNQVQPFTISGCVASDIGRLRPDNEDNYVWDGHIHISPNAVQRREVAFPAASGTGWHIAGVFDGMGGGEQGGLASHIAAEVFGQAYLDMVSSASKVQMDAQMRGCFQNANNRIAALKKKYEIYGTTGTVVCTNGSAFKIYHLGDSRAYLFRDGMLFLLTKDQTLAQMKMDLGMGSIAPGDHHRLTEFIGRDMTLENICPLESRWISVRPNDRLLLCSDGLHGLCGDQQIADICKASRSAKTAVQEMVDKAMDLGGVDNITCLIMDFS